LEAALPCALERRREGTTAGRRIELSRLRVEPVVRLDRRRCGKAWIRTRAPRPRRRLGCRLRRTGTRPQRFLVIAIRGGAADMSVAKHRDRDGRVVDRGGLRRMRACKAEEDGPLG